MSAAPGPAARPLPHGFTVTLDRHTLVLDDGHALLGGSPTRLLRLAPRARALLTGRTLRVHDAAGAALADLLLERGLAHPLVDALPEHPDPRCTYVVPVRDRPQQLDRLLGSLEPGSEVIVVDDASHDRAAVATVAARHGARFVPLAVNVGPAGARNAGLRLVRTPFVVFVDSDIVLAPGTVTTLLRHFTDERVAIAVPRITGLRTARSSSWIGRYEEVRSSLDLGAHPASVRPGSFVSWASTACTVARVDAVADGFDPRMRVGEDVDFGWRAVARGWRLRYEPAVVAAHEHRVSFGDWFVRKAVYGSGAQPLAERHPQAIAPAVLAPWSTVMVMALLAQRRWSLPVAAGVCGVTTLRIARKLESTGHPVRLGARLTANGAVAALSQTAALVTRHWWPVTALGCLVSTRVRRAAAVAAVADVALEHRTAPTGLDPVRYTLARRLDDLAYGAGVWFSAARGRSLAALRPRLVLGTGGQKPAASRRSVASSRTERSEPGSSSHIS
ncbi:mycofactocin biosynthesis glycosyltransferase MftF [Streptomyces sp. NBC_01754]|uniref:mycofactocin biosynthesis glycosyltransferase MftF n=1 Tax=Streptomyces sp. NBC_01754 TaxID=2975930 RepID=UPI002DD7EF01|nr:mycofactocin biosynthesis glycosyltransferase MftF [Streptomyces sp. NBC_01754]WSC94345.1 mycofactocin biosynthesis glycosyltransferase MftF [Streptomyces sp. NBC_01754]